MFLGLRGSHVETLLLSSSISFSFPWIVFLNILMTNTPEVDWANRFVYHTYTEPLDWAALDGVSLRKVSLPTLQSIVRTLSFGHIAIEDIRGRTLGEVHHMVHVMQAALQYTLHCQQFLFQVYHANQGLQLQALQQDKFTAETKDRTVLTKQLEDRASQLERMKVKIDKVEAKVAKAKGQRDEARTELVRVLKEIKEKNTESSVYSVHNEFIGHLKQELSSSRLQEALQRDEIAQLRGQLAESMVKLHSEEDKRKHLEANVLRLEQNTTNLQESFSHMSAKRYECLTRDYTEIAEKLLQLTHQKEIADSELTKAQSELSIRAEEVRRLQCLIEEETAQGKGKAEQIHEMLADKSAKEVLLQKLNEENASLTAKHDTLVQENSALDAKIESMRQSSTSRGTQLRDLEQHYEELLQQIADKRRAVEEREQERTRVRGMMEPAAEKIGAISRSNENLKPEAAQKSSYVDYSDYFAAKSEIGEATSAEDRASMLLQHDKNSDEKKKIDSTQSDLVLSGKSLAEHDRESEAKKPDDRQSTASELRRASSTMSGRPRDPKLDAYYQELAELEKQGWQIS